MMIKLENTEVMGWEAAIRGMRNPMNSWEKSDTSICVVKDEDKCKGCDAFRKNDGIFSFCTQPFIVGSNDYDLMKRLRNAGTDHRKFMRMITVYVDITAPLYWWKEFDTYKVGTVANSCSTMHKIADKEFTLEDFSCEHLLWSGDIIDDNGEHPDLTTPGELFEDIITMLNTVRGEYLRTKRKAWWWQMIQLLPSSYNQKRTVLLNYEVLANMYKSRKNHKLDEWKDLCAWVKTLPYSELITGEFNET